MKGRKKQLIQDDEKPQHKIKEERAISDTQTIKHDSKT